MYNINNYYKFIAVRFLLELSVETMATTLGIPVSKVESIESDKCVIEPIYSYALNYLIDQQNNAEDIYTVLKHSDLQYFAHHIDRHTKLSKLECSKCHSRNLHVMKSNESNFFVQCLDCREMMFKTGKAVKRYEFWKNKGLMLNHHLF